MPMSYAWAAGDVSLNAYIQANFTNLETMKPGVSTLASIMSFLYVTYVSMAVCAPNHIHRYFPDCLVCSPQWVAWPSCRYSPWEACPMRSQISFRQKVRLDICRRGRWISFNEPWTIPITLLYRFSSQSSPSRCLSLPSFREEALPGTPSSGNFNNNQRQKRFMPFTYKGL
jgi:hypothetical protein